MENSRSGWLGKKNGHAPPPAPQHEPNDERDDTKLIEACLGGNQAAWKELVNRYARLVYSVPRRYGLSESDADDVFQNVFTIVFRRLSSLRQKTHLAPWLITIAHREAMRIGKRSIGSAELDEAVEDDGVPPLDQVQTWERQHLVHRALDKMNFPCRDLLVALFLSPEGASYENIAAQLEIPLGSIGPTRARCFKKLEAILASFGIDGNG